MKTALDLNLDDETESQNFLNRFDEPSRQVARELFPARQRGYLKQTNNLLLYATYKQLAIDFRRAGRIDRAISYERACDRIYNQMSEWAKGW